MEGRGAVSAETHFGGYHAGTSSGSVDSIARALDSPRCVRILMDSGSFLHVCPPSFAPEVPVRYDEHQLRAVAANGHALRFYGMKKVTLATAGGVLFVVDFAVMDVSQTILSVGKLHKRGHDVIFGQNS
eukprot:10118741-Heterocapsa_arctica.AAC.1